MINTARPLLTPLSQSSLPEPQTTKVSIQFWGVRGSVPTPVAANQRYGGNTLCVEVLIGGQRIIFDAGTGLVNLGHQLQQQTKPIEAHVLFTHTQWDRIQGFPFFKPAFNPDNHFTVYGGTAPNGASIKHCLTDQMLLPHFTMPLQNMLAGLSFQTLLDKNSFNIGEVSVDVCKINPTTEALGYRLTWEDYTLVYATDTPSQKIDFDFLKLCDRADLLIYDGTYDDLSYLHHVAENQSTPQPWEIGIDIAQKANVKKLALLHHSPVQDDTTLDQLQIDIRDRFPAATIAYEGLIIES